MFCQHFTRYVVSDINHNPSLTYIPIQLVWDRETVYAKLRFREWIIEFYFFYYYDIK